MNAALSGIDRIVLFAIDTEGMLPFDKSNPSWYVEAYGVQPRVQ